MTTTEMALRNLKQPELRNDVEQYLRAGPGEGDPSKLPGNITKAEIAPSLAYAEWQMNPVSDNEFDITMDKLFNYITTFINPNMTGEGIEKATRIYHDALKRLPGDLLSEAVDSVIQNWRWGKQMPKPGDIMAYVADDYGWRILRRGRLKIAVQGAYEETPKGQTWHDLTDAEKAAFDSKIKAMTSGIKRMEA